MATYQKDEVVISDIDDDTDRLKIIAANHIHLLGRIKYLTGTLVIIPTVLMCLYMIVWRPTDPQMPDVWKLMYIVIGAAVGAIFAGQTNSNS